MNENKIDYIKLHTSVLLAGFTGIFAKLISLNECVIVWYRMILAFIFFAIILLFSKNKVYEKPLEAFKISTLGILLSIHLIFFFGSIKYSNIAIGVVCYSLVGFFTAIFEPIICKTKFSFIELLYSLLAVFGIWLIFSFDSSYQLGIILGIISAALFAFYTIFTKTIEVGKSSRCMLFYELLGGCFILSLFLPIILLSNPSLSFIPTGVEWLWITVLALICTVILYLLHISVLKTISAFTVSLVGNLEPIYGILFAILFMGEAQELSVSFYLGMILILLSVFLQSATSGKKDYSPKLS